MTLKATDKGLFFFLELWFLPPLHNALTSVPRTRNKDSTKKTRDLFWLHFKFSRCYTRASIREKKKCFVFSSKFFKENGPLIKIGTETKSAAVLGYQFIKELYQKSVSIGQHLPYKGLFYMFLLNYINMATFDIYRMCHKFV